MNLTTGTLSLAVTIIGGWMWVTSFFVTQDSADLAHAAFTQDIRTTYLELKIDNANGELAFIEQGGIRDEDKREYDLLKFSVERMTQSLMELGP